MIYKRTSEYLYAKLFWDYVETREARKLHKTREFVHQIFDYAISDVELNQLATNYDILPLVKESVNGLAKAIGRQIANGLELVPFNPQRVSRGIRIYSCALNHDDTIGLTDPIGSTAVGEYFFGDFIASMHSAKKKSDYTIIVYEAFEYAFTEYLKRIHDSFDLVPMSQRYVFLGSKALSREDIEPFTRMLFMILALIVDQPANFDDFYGFYLDSLWDYHHEKTGRFLLETGLTNSKALAKALQGELLDVFCPAIEDNCITEYFKDPYCAEFTANQLMSAQLGDALYMVS